MFTRMITDTQGNPSNTPLATKQTLGILFITIMFFCALALSYSFWVQKNTNLIPCKFCILQQTSYTLIFLISLVGFLGKQNWVLVALKITLVLSAGIAGYHALVQFGIVKDLCIRHSPLTIEQFDQILIQSLNSTPPSNACSSKLPLLFGIPLSVYNFAIFITFYFSTQYLAVKSSKIKAKTQELQ